jgi:DNA invertase Pin-like site-specific DNA recombinase
MVRGLDGPNHGGYQIVGECTDTISGSKDKRPRLDQLMSDAQRGRFDMVFGVGV